MAQQTATEWLMLEMLKPDMYRIWPTLLERAKAMERQQLANSWDKACDQYIYRDGNLVKVWKDFDKYYKDNYGSDNQI
jgi:hypothetical protein